MFKKLIVIALLTVFSFKFSPNFAQAATYDFYTDSSGISGFTQLPEGPNGELVAARTNPDQNASVEIPFSPSLDLQSLIDFNFDFLFKSGYWITGSNTITIYGELYESTETNVASQYTLTADLYNFVSSNPANTWTTTSNATTNPQILWHLMIPGYQCEANQPTCNKSYLTWQDVLAVRDLSIARINRVRVDFGSITYDMFGTPSPAGAVFDIDNLNLVMRPIDTPTAIPTPTAVPTVTPTPTPTQNKVMILRQCILDAARLPKLEARQYLLDCFKTNKPYPLLFWINQLSNWFKLRDIPKLF